MFKNPRTKSLVLVLILGLVIAGGIFVALLIRQSNLSTQDSSADVLSMPFRGCLPRPACLDSNPPCEIAVGNYCPPSGDKLGTTCDPKNTNSCPSGTTCRAIIPDCANPRVTTPGTANGGSASAVSGTPGVNCQLQYRCQRLNCPEYAQMVCPPGQVMTTATPDGKFLGPNGCPPPPTCRPIGSSSSSSSSRGICPLIALQVCPAGTRHPVNSNGCPESICVPDNTGGSISCGSIDVNGDGKIDFSDLASFAKSFGRNCSNTGGGTTANSTKTVNVVANNVGTNDNSAKLRLTGTNVQIIDFKPSATFPIVIPECDGGTSFTTTQVCASLGRSTAIKNGDVIGTVTVKITAAAGGNVPVAKLDKTSQNGYQGDGTPFVVDQGNVSTFQVISPVGCGNQDSNSDGKIDITDFAHFASLYGKPSCLPE